MGNPFSVDEARGRFGCDGIQRAGRAPPSARFSLHECDKESTRNAAEKTRIAVRAAYNRAAAAIAASVDIQSSKY
jgi:hypothetical protein